MADEIKDADISKILNEAVFLTITFKTKDGESASFEQCKESSPLFDDVLFDIKRISGL